MAKIGDGNLLHASSHLEVNSINHGSETSTRLPKEKERSSGEIVSCKWQEINQNLQKLQDNNTKLETLLNKATMEIEKGISISEINGLFDRELEVRRDYTWGREAGERYKYETHCF